MTDLNLEHYLGLAAILGIEIYDYNKQNNKTNKTNKNNVLKGGVKNPFSGVKNPFSGVKNPFKKKPLTEGAKGNLQKMKDKDAAKKAFENRNWKSDKAKGAIKGIGKGMGKGAAASGKAFSKGVDGIGEFAENTFSPSGIMKFGLMIGAVMFMIFMGLPSMFIITMLVLSWKFLKIQINRYFPQSNNKSIKDLSSLETNNNTNTNTNNTNNNMNNL